MAPAGSLFGDSNDELDVDGGGGGGGGGDGLNGLTDTLPFAVRSPPFAAFHRSSAAGDGRTSSSRSFESEASYETFHSPMKEHSPKRATKVSDDSPPASSVTGLKDLEGSKPTKPDGEPDHSRKRGAACPSEESDENAHEGTCSSSVPSCSSPSCSSSSSDQGTEPSSDDSDAEESLVGSTVDPPSARPGTPNPQINILRLGVLHELMC